MVPSSKEISWMEGDISWELSVSGERVVVFHDHMMTQVNVTSGDQDTIYYLWWYSVSAR